MPQNRSSRPNRPSQTSGAYSQGGAGGSRYGEAGYGGGGSNRGGGGGGNRGGGNRGGSRGGGRKGGGRPSKRRGFWGTLVYWGAVLGLWGAIAGVGVFIWVASDLPNPEELLAKTDRPSIVYVDVNGEVIARRGAADAPPVDLKSMPDYVPHAILAIEDRKFYRHWGFDFEGLVRALFTNLRAGHTVQGGSTLTQQLAKNLFLSSEQTVRRKAQELLLSLWLESRFTKDEILSLYMARVYFGAGAYGIVDASERYFNKTPDQLSVAEAALLAGLLKAPSRYSPVSNANRAAQRATVVLNVMAEQGYITPEQRRAAGAGRVRFAQTARGAGVNYFLDWISDDVGAIVGEPAEDIIVQTTLDLRQQRAAEIALSDEFAHNSASLHMGQGALIALSGTGGVRAMIGGTNYNTSEFNRVTDATRQPGSSFKPFVYLAAMETRGVTPYDVRTDQALRIGDWSPQNYDGRYHGSMRLIQALANSINTIAVQLGEEAGRDNVVRVARRLGIRGRLVPEPTLALGTEVVRPIELATAYVPFSNGGYGVNAHGFTRIQTKSGTILWERPVPRARRVIDDTNLRNMNLMMAQVVSAGTGHLARLADRPVAGKTGTTNDYRDAWFVGFTGDYVAVVWVGNDDYGRMNRVTGGTAPTRIWHAFMVNAMAGLPARAIRLPVPGESPVPPENVDLTNLPPSIGLEVPADVPQLPPGEEPMDDNSGGVDSNMGPDKPPADQGPPTPNNRPPSFTVPQSPEAQPANPANNNQARTRSLEDLMREVQGQRKPG